MTPLLSVKDLVKIYRLGRVDVVALRGITLDVYQGELLAVTGPSGCGKTTLISIMGGIEPPSAGSVLMGGQDITRLRRRELVGFRRHAVGIVFQFFSLVPYLTALQNVELPMKLDGMPTRKCSERASELLSSVDLQAREDHKPSELSGGEQQRVAIAVALANDPPLVLADEPTGELDTSTGRRIVDLFGRLREEYGKTIVIASHEERVVQVADRVVVMKDGEIAKVHSPKDKQVEGVLKYDNSTGEK